MRDMTTIIAYHHNNDGELGQNHTGFTNFESVEELNKRYEEIIATGHYGIYILVGKDFVAHMNKMIGVIGLDDPMIILTLT